MLYTVFLALSFAVLTTGVVFAVISSIKNKQGLFRPINLLFAFTAVANVMILFPPTLDAFRPDCGIFGSVLISAVRAIQVFTLNCDYDIIATGVAQLSIGGLYSCFASALFLISPLLGVGFILSFFKGVTTLERYALSYFRDAYIFSSLSPASLALATDVKKNNRRAIFVFLSVDKDNSLSEEAERFGAICFSFSILSGALSHHSRTAKMSFFFIDESQGQNAIAATKLLTKYNERKNTSFFVFASGDEYEALINTAECGTVELRKLDTTRSLIYDYLFNSGTELFDSARARGGRREIRASVIGLGECGLSFAKNLVWYCQMTGYMLYLDLFDKSGEAISRFRAQCPELFAQDKCGESFDTENASYEIHTHEMDCLGEEFFKSAERLAPTFVAVATGSDMSALGVAARIKTVFKYHGYSPIIKAFVYDTRSSLNARELALIGGPSDIGFIGGIENIYKYETLVNPAYEADAIRRHKRWGSIEDFYKYDYNYSSSASAAIHREAKRLIGIPGIEKEPSERTPEERLAIRKLEHARWCAYMRSVGYSYGEKKCKIAKSHPCLVNFSSLPPEEQEKDDD